MKKYQLELFCYDAAISEDYSWVEIHKLEISPPLLEKMAEVGIIEIHQGCIRGDQIQRIYKALRLRQTLGVNFSGTGIILDLLERMEELRNELERLRQGS